MEMTKEDFIREFAKMMRETYPSVTDDLVRLEFESQMSGNPPTNIIGMFMSRNLKKITIQKD